ncbi:MAG: SxtJ family membrane protein [Snowella sp.]|nr:SxtJ family membrane protein [Snowella sp.]
MSEQKKLTTKELREFGLLMAGFIAVLFGVIIPLLRAHSLPALPWIIAGIFIILAFLLPKSLEPIYQIWMKIGFVLGWLNNRIILSFVFFVILTPMALMMKVIKRDTMARGFDLQAETYRVPSNLHPRSTMEKPY